MFRAVHNTGCTWWCAARWWAQRIQLHPVFGVALRGLYSCVQYLQYQSAHLLQAITRHTATLGLVFQSLGENGLYLKIPHTADPKGFSSFTDLTGLDRDPSNYIFRADTDPGKHLLRTFGRLCVLKQIRSSRNDAEGDLDIDVEVCSSPTWKAWQRTLLDRDKFFLEIWRSGAVRTPTRRVGAGIQPVCPYCAFPHASFRHFMAERSHFSDFQHTSFAVDFPSNSVPRVAIKSGWITLKMAPTVTARCDLLIRLSKLALYIGRRINPDLQPDFSN